MQISFKQYTSLLARYLKPQQGRVVGLAIALLGSIGVRFFSQLVIHVFSNGILLLGILIILFVENSLAGISLRT